MGVRDVVARIRAGNPRCQVCGNVGSWNCAGTQLCDEHKRDYRDMGFTSQPRRC